MPTPNTSSRAGTASGSHRERDPCQITPSQTRLAGDVLEGDRPLLSFFIPDLTVGGAEQVTVNIVNGLSARGHNVDLLLSRSEGELRDQLESRVKVIELGPPRIAAFGVAAHLPALVDYLRRKKPAVLFPHLAHVSVVCLAANRLFDFDTAVVPTHHKAFGTAKDQTPKDQIVRRLVPRLYPSADRIIAVSEGVADSIVERTSVDRRDISVLYNPIEVESVRERARQSVDHEWIEYDNLEVILFVGRLEQQKDLETWLRTFKMIHEWNPNTRAVIVGRGSLRKELIGLANRLGIADVVSLPGYVQNPYRYMRRAKVFLLTSRYEGLPTVIIEALACGCSVVSTDCPSGPSEILANGEYGRLAPVGDVSELANAVIEMTENPLDSGKLRSRANEFAPESVFDDYETLIGNLLSDNGEMKTDADLAE